VNPSTNGYGQNRIHVVNLALAVDYIGSKGGVANSDFSWNTLKTTFESPTFVKREAFH
jgi:hypothetical protein